MVGETSEDAKQRKEALLNAIPLDAVGAFISHHCGYDLSLLPDRFTINEINEQITASNASPVNFLRLTYGIEPTVPITREAFYREMKHHTAGYDHTVAGSAAEIADYLEEMFAATGERGGFMIAHPPATPRDLLNVVDYLVPELQRRGRFRTAYKSKLLKENLLDS